MLRIAKWRTSTILRLDCDTPGCGAKGPALVAPLDPEEWDIAAVRAACAQGFTTSRRIEGLRRTLIARCPKCSGHVVTPPQLRLIGIA